MKNVSFVFFIQNYFYKSKNSDFYDLKSVFQKKFKKVA